MLVAHSLGTVVRLQVLLQRPELRIGTLVTMGSPLGMRLLASRPSRLWPVAEDIRVDNGDQPHSSYKYLLAGATGRVLAQLVP